MRSAEAHDRGECQPMQCPVCAYEDDLERLEREETDA